MTYTYDLGNGAEDYEFSTEQEAINEACNRIEGIIHETRLGGADRVRRMDFDILCNGVVVRKAWASMNDCGFYKEKEMV